MDGRELGHIMKMTTDMAVQGLSVWRGAAPVLARTTTACARSVGLGGDGIGFHDLCRMCGQAIQCRVQRLPAPRHYHQRTNDTVQQFTLTTRNALDPHRHPASFTRQGVLCPGGRHQNGGRQARVRRDLDARGSRQGR